MSAIVQDLYVFFGFPEVPPVLFGDFMIWFVKFFFGVCIVAFVFKMFSHFASIVFGAGRWMK